MRNITILFCIIFLSACNWDVAKVGNLPVSQKDLDLRVKVSEIYYPGNGKAFVGLSQLIKGYLSVKILRLQGRILDDAVVKGEAKRIDDATKAPNMLAKIKAVYGNDRKAYLDTFVRLVYAERVLYSEVFLKSREIQKEKREMAEELLRSTAAAPAAFADQAKQKGSTASILKISREKGIVPYSQPKGMPVRQEGPVGVDLAERIIPLLAGLRPGQVCPDVIELQESFLVIRYQRKEGRNYIIESVAIPKRSYDDWFWSEASKIPVKINNQALKDSLLKEVSWAKNLSLK